MDQFNCRNLMFSEILIIHNRYNGLVLLHINHRVVQSRPRKKKIVTSPWVLTYSFYSTSKYGLTDLSVNRRIYCIKLFSHSEPSEMYNLFPLSLLVKYWRPKKVQSIYLLQISISICPYLYIFFFFKMI